jgi:nucleoside-diphosphate-sugar epimerase
VHTAALVREWGPMEDFVRVNVGGTVSVLDAAAAAGVSQAVHISSVVIYGYDDPSEQPEEAYRRTYGIPYIDTKSASDRLACRRGAVVIRPGDVYGPGSIPWIMRPLDMAKAGRLALPRDSGVMLPCYVDDLVEAIALALQKGEAGDAYAVWDDTVPVSFEEHFERIARIAGAGKLRRLPRNLQMLLATIEEAQARVRHRPPSFGSNGLTLVSRRGTASTARARERLGWKPRIGYEEGMRETEEWLRSEGLVA